MSPFAFCDLWQALLKAGILRKTDNGRIEFPFDAVRVDVVLRAA